MLLEKRLETLERRMGELKRALGIKPVKTSKNSSVPPSQEQKVNRNGQKKAKRGAKKDIGGQVARREPDEIIECRVSQCQACGTDLSDLLQHVAARHQVLRYSTPASDCPRSCALWTLLPLLSEVSKGRSAARL
ncbi:MAG: hypothetical protein Q9P01_15020 [Anaerolineae bacterium]|nr:hypothetical protein [Anaerolineae bacterium]